MFKDWVPTKEEYNKFHFYNIKLLKTAIANRDKLNVAYKDRKFSEDGYWRWVEKIDAHYKKKEEKRLDDEDVEIARDVEAYEARERVIVMEAQGALKRQIKMEAETARDRQIAKEIEEAEDENYVVDLSQF